MSHGTRKGYQSGCRLSCCRRAEANYRRELRAQLCRGKLPPGARVNARATWRLINKLLKAGYKRYQIAQFLGLKRPKLEWHPERVEQRTAERIQALYERLMAEGPELQSREA